MGYVTEIYTSKLNAVQQRLNAVSSRTGAAMPVFYDVYATAIEAAAAEPQAADMALYAQAAQAEAQALDESGPAAVSARAGDYDTTVQSVAAMYDLEPNLIKAVIQAESSFREDTVSSAGAQGLMQLKPATAAELGVNDSFDAVQNMMGGAKYLRAQVDRFGDLRLALAAYNAGPYAIEELNITDPDDSLQYAKIAANVRDYVSDVMRYYDTFNEQDGQGGA